MKTKKKKNVRSFLSLSPAERDREVSRFDGPIDIEKETRPLSAKERARFEKWRRGPSKSVYMFEVDPKLLNKTVSAARKRGMSVDQFINQALRGMLAFSGQ
jgi:hypothetical protein